MEVPDGMFDTRKVVYVVDTFGGRWCAVKHEVESVNDVFGGGDLIACIEGIQSVFAFGRGRTDIKLTSTLVIRTF